MNITLSTPTFDLRGHVQLHALPDSDVGTVTRRVNRVATLDGGVAVNDQGFSDGDRTMTVRFRPGPDTDADLRRMMRLYPVVHAAMPEGVFEAAISAYGPDRGGASLTLLVIKKITE